jgi:hypothetical protein
MEGNIRLDVKGQGMDCIKLNINDRVKWWTVVNSIMNVPFYEVELKEHTFKLYVSTSGTSMEYFPHTGIQSYTCLNFVHCVMNQF